MKPQSPKNHVPAVSFEAIDLPKPKLRHTGSVAEALEKRKTTREISTKKLSFQTISNLLWAAGGVNRRTGPFGIPGRTAGSASNSQEVDIFVALEDGIYFYDFVRHRIVPTVAGDFRSLAIGPGQTAFAAHAPLHLIYVADIHRLSHSSGYKEPGLLDEEIQKSYYFVDTGLIAANVYLFAASEGLAAWFHNCNKPTLTEKLNLRPDQKVLFGQTVGFAEKK